MSGMSCHTIDNVWCDISWPGLLLALPLSNTSSNNSIIIYSLISVYFKRENLGFKLSNPSNSCACTIIIVTVIVTSDVHENQFSVSLVQGCLFSFVVIL